MVFVGGLPASVPGGSLTLNSSSRLHAVGSRLVLAVITDFLFSTNIKLLKGISFFLLVVDGSDLKFLDPTLR
jgi:hypothetical protein